jgi:membrane-associated protease RseP (regulator of RpoE activity)
VGFAGQDVPDANADPDRPLIIDADATLLTAHPEKEQAAPTFKRGFGFHPLWAAAGLRVGDIVVAVDGKPIPSATDLQRLMVEDAIGKPVEITIWRNGALVDVIAVPRELDSSA